MTTEPLWWTDARMLRAQGKSLITIGRKLGKDHSSVMYAVNGQAWRDARRAASKARMKPTQRPNQRLHSHRKKVVEAAHDEAARRGLHVDLILIAWGQPVRRERQSRRAGA